MLEVDPITAPYLREAFERLDAGEAVRVVARRIAGLPEAARGGRAWSYPSVRKALSAAVYVARHEVGADEVLST